ncbi:MAG: hypothetical protein OXT67_04865 [Zetaproteobacteria bacterium]|nr:hypothetical protein [Zetaproteobacteria bacterium]
MASIFILWLTPEKDAFQQSATERLAQLDIACTWVHSIEQLTAQLHAKRPLSILVSDTPTRELPATYITRLGGIDVARKTRWILLYHRERRSLFRLAASCQFRDCIPMELDMRSWGDRLRFALAGKGVLPNIQTTRMHIRESTNIILPAKLVWIDRQSIRIEGYTNPPLASELILAGGLIREAFSQAITVQVEKVEKQHLNYRFSNAVEGSWRVPGLTQDEALHHLHIHRQPSAPKKGRIYVVVRQKSIREHITAGFSNHEYDLQYALQTQNIVKEPQFYSPDLIFLDAGLMQPPQQREYLHECLEHLPPQATMIIVGDQLQSKDLEHHQHLLTSERLKLVPLLTQDYMRQLRLGLERSRAADDHLNKIFLERADELSCVYLKTTARMVEVNASSAYLEFDFPVRKYAIMEMTSPLLSEWLQSSAMLKVMSVQPTPTPTPAEKQDATTQRFLTYCFFCDLSGRKRHVLAHALLRYFGTSLGIRDLYPTKTVIAKPLSETDYDFTQPPGTPLKELEVEVSTYPKPEDSKPEDSKPSEAEPEEEQEEVYTSQGERKHRKALIESFRHPSLDLRFFKNLLIVALTVCIAILVLRVMVPYLQKHVHRSGAPFTKSILNFMNRQSDLRRGSP